VLGRGGRFIYASCVAASCFGVVNAVTFTTSRLVCVAAKNRHLPSLFGKLHPRYLTPVSALLFSGFLSSLFLLIGNLRSLIMFQGIVEWTWYLVSLYFESNLL
jgi:amino acid transporter